MGRRSLRRRMRRVLGLSADRIDRETAELPRDKDGEGIRIGDVIYDRFINEDVRIEGMVFKSEREILTNFGYVKPHRLTRHIPDGFGRIADDIEAAEDWCDQNGECGCIVSSVSAKTLGDRADRIRKPAAKKESQR